MKMIFTAEEVKANIEEFRGLIKRTTLPNKEQILENLGNSGLEMFVPNVYVCHLSDIRHLKDVNEVL